MNEKSVSVKLPGSSADSYLAVVTRRVEYERYLAGHGISYSFYNDRPGNAQSTQWWEMYTNVILAESDAVAFKLKFGL